MDLVYAYGVWLKSKAFVYSDDFYCVYISMYDVSNLERDRAYVDQQKIWNY